MSVLGLDHVNLRTTDLAATVRFYTEAIGLSYDGPQAVEGFTRHWLRDEAGRAVVHLRELAPVGEPTGAVDHLAFACRDLAAVLERLRRAGVPCSVYEGAGGVAQVFLKDPSGVAIELNVQLD